MNLSEKEAKKIFSKLVDDVAAGTMNSKQLTDRIIELNFAKR